MADGKQLDAVDKEHVSPVGRCPPPPTPPVKPRPPQALKSFLPPPPRPSLVTRPPLPEAISQATPTGTPEEAAVDSTVVDGNEERGDDHRQGLGKRSLGAIKLKLKQQPSIKKTKFEAPADRVLINKSLSKSVATAFGSDSDEEEDVPAEAMFRMRNVGKNTPTSAGPNSFNKSRGGFSDPRGSWRNELTD